MLYWFGVDEPALYAPERCPVFIWLHGRGGQRASMYGFPMVDGIAGPKVASEQDTVESDPDRVDRQVDEDDAKSVYEDHVRGRLRGVTARVLRTATCLYTSTPDASFLVRPHPESDGDHLRLGLLGPRLQAFGGARRSAGAAAARPRRLRSRSTRSSRRR